MVIPNPLDPRAARSEIEIGTPVERVFRALSDPSDLKQWFPLEAAGQSGERGVIRFGWGTGRLDPMRIDLWEPPHHLRMVQLSANPGLDLVTDLHLRGRSGRTHLRVETTGFPQDAVWDALVQGTSVSYRFLLLQLRHYLERHQGEDRDVVCVCTRVALSRDEAWQRLEAARSRELSLESVIDSAGPWQLIGTVADPPGLLRLAIDPVRDDSRHQDVSVWLSTWGAATDAVQSAARRIREALDGAFPGAPGLETSLPPEPFVAYNLPPGFLEGQGAVKAG